MSHKFSGLAFHHVEFTILLEFGGQSGLVDWGVGEKQPVHWFLGGRIAVIQQGAIVWVGSPKYEERRP